MKKIRMIFMLATFAIAMGAAFAFTPKHVAECNLLRKCDTSNEFIPMSGNSCDSDDQQGKCEYLDDRITPCDDANDGCANVPTSHK
jgi:hypothetical protein